MLFVNLFIFETRCNLGLNSEWNALNISTFQWNAICLLPICAIEHLALLLCKSCFFSGSLYADFRETTELKLRAIYVSPDVSIRYGNMYKNYSAICQLWIKVKVNFFFLDSQGETSSMFVLWYYAPPVFVKPSEVNVTILFYKPTLQPDDETINVASLRYCGLCLQMGFF